MVRSFRYLLALIIAVGGVAILLGQQQQEIVATTHTDKFLPKSERWNFAYKAAPAALDKVVKQAEVLPVTTQMAVSTPAVISGTVATSEASAKSLMPVTDLVGEHQAGH